MGEDQGRVCTLTQEHRADHRGEDVNLSKPGPRLTQAKRRQIAAAEKYRKAHCGCTLHNACIKSFVPETGGYASGKSLYLAMLRANLS